MWRAILHPPGSMDARDPRGNGGIIFISSVQRAREKLKVLEKRQRLLYSVEARGSTPVALLVINTEVRPRRVLAAGLR